MSTTESHGQGSSPGEESDTMHSPNPTQDSPQPAYSPLFLSEYQTPESRTPFHIPGPFAVLVPPAERPWEYSTYQDNTIDEILSVQGKHGSKYVVRLRDGRKLTVSE